MQIYKLETIITTTGGTGSANSLNVIGGICRQVYIKSSTSGTSFRVTITDNGSRIIREYDYSTDFILDETPLIMQGVYTIQILNSNKDQDFNILFMVGE
jgi:hypothetical protein